MRGYVRLALVALIALTLVGARSGGQGGGSGGAVYTGAPFVIPYFGDTQHITTPRFWWRDFREEIGSNYGEKSWPGVWYGTSGQMLAGSLSDIIRSAKEENVPFVMQVGDIASCAPTDCADSNSTLGNANVTAQCRAHWETVEKVFLGRLRSAQIPYIMARGNHDPFGGDSWGWVSSFGPAWVTEMESYPGVHEAQVLDTWKDFAALVTDCGGNTCIALAAPSCRPVGADAIADDSELIGMLQALDDDYPGAAWFTTEHWGYANVCAALQEIDTFSGTWFFHTYGHGSPAENITDIRGSESGCAGVTRGLMDYYNHQNRPWLAHTYRMLRVRPEDGELDIETFDPQKGGTWRRWSQYADWTAHEAGTTMLYTRDLADTRIAYTGDPPAASYDSLHYEPLPEASGNWLAHDACILSYAVDNYTDRNRCANAPAGNGNEDKPNLYTASACNGSPGGGVGSRSDGVPLGSQTNATAWCTRPVLWENFQEIYGTSADNDAWDGEDYQGAGTTAGFCFTNNTDTGMPTTTSDMVRPDGYLISAWVEDMGNEPKVGHRALGQYNNDTYVALGGYWFDDSATADGDFRWWMGNVSFDAAVPDLTNQAGPVHIAWAWGFNDWGAGGTGGCLIPYVNGVAQCTCGSDCPLYTGVIEQQCTVENCGGGEDEFYVLRGWLGCVQDFLMLDLTEIDPADQAELTAIVQGLKVCGSDDTATEATRASNYGTPSSIQLADDSGSCSN